MSTATAPQQIIAESTDAHAADNTDRPLTDQPVSDQQRIGHDTAAVVVVQLDPAQVAQHPDNIRDASRGIKELTASVAKVGVLVPLIVVPVALSPAMTGPIPSPTLRWMGTAARPQRQRPAFPCRASSAPTSPPPRPPHGPWP